MKFSTDLQLEECVLIMKAKRKRAILQNYHSSIWLPTTWKLFSDMIATQILEDVQEWIAYVETQKIL